MSNWVENVWIDQKNRLMYFKMMNDAGPRPVVHNDWPDKLLVDFFEPVLDQWIEAGYWYEIQQ
jgi:hypothetical protein